MRMRNLLLYTLPQGSVVANIGSKEYTEVSEQKVKEYVIWQTVDNKAYVALDFVKKVHEYGMQRTSRSESCDDRE